jgi:hypothetical protein
MRATMDRFPLKIWGMLGLLLIRLTIIRIRDQTLDSRKISNSSNSPSMEAITKVFMAVMKKHQSKCIIRLEEKAI